MENSFKLFLHFLQVREVDFDLQSWELQVSFVMDVIFFLIEGVESPKFMST